MDTKAELVVIGAGAAGLMAGISAARRARGARVLLLDGAQKLGAKILVSGGGRCNLTHDIIDSQLYSGSTHAAIRKVLRRFDLRQTLDFFQKIGVPVKREDSGKLFPESNRARTVLDALLTAAEDAQAELHPAKRVADLARSDNGFIVKGSWGRILAKRAILATGGKALPRSGSDGAGYAFARRLGHTLTPSIHPALVPLVLQEGHFLTRLSGTSCEAEMRVLTASGKRVARSRGALLLTHFGLSGPATLDISRHLLSAREEDPAAQLTIDFLPTFEGDELKQHLAESGQRDVSSVLRRMLPKRLVAALLDHARTPTDRSWNQSTRTSRRTLLRTLTGLDAPIAAHRGFARAEVTAGGVPLAELRLETMASRPCPGLHLCGEICDVDGPIGGYNFQWAWSSAFAAGSGAAASL